MKSVLVMLMLAASVTFAGEVLLEANDAAAWPGKVKAVADNAFAVPATNRTISVNSIKVDAEKTIRISGEFRFPGTVEKGAALLYFGFRPMAEDGKVINALNINQAAKTALTELAAPAAKGDTKLIVKDASTWTKLTKYYRIAFFVNADFSDMPNYKLSPIPKTVTAKEDGTYLVELHGPLAFDAPAGTALRMHTDSSNFIYSGSAGGKLTPEWQTFSGTIKGMRPGAGNRFWWKGSHMAQVVFFAHGARISGNLEFRNIKVEIAD